MQNSQTPTPGNIVEAMLDELGPNFPYPSPEEIAAHRWRAEVSKKYPDVLLSDIRAMSRERLESGRFKAVALTESICLDLSDKEVVACRRRHECKNSDGFNEKEKSLQRMVRFKLSPYLNGGEK